MSEKNKPSEEAMRAAKHINPRDSMSDADVARIIDRETGLPDLLAVCETALKLIHDEGENNPLNRFDFLDALRAAISKATRKPAEAQAGGAQ